MVPIYVAVVSAIIAGVICGTVCFFVGISHRRKVAEANIGSAEAEATRLVNDAIRSAEQRRKEVILEAKDEIYKLRAESDRELRDRRSEVQRQERRLTQREETLDKKQEQNEAETARLQKRSEQLEQKIREADELTVRQTETLEKISAASGDGGLSVPLFSARTAGARIASRHVRDSGGRRRFFGACRRGYGRQIKAPATGTVANTVTSTVTSG